MLAFTTFAKVIAFEISRRASNQVSLLCSLHRELEVRGGQMLTERALEFELLQHTLSLPGVIDHPASKLLPILQSTDLQGYFLIEIYLRVSLKLSSG